MQAIARVIELTAGATARRGNALDRGGHGQDGRHQRQFGAAHLARARAQALSGLSLKVSIRPRRRRVYCRP